MDKEEPEIELHRHRKQEYYKQQTPPRVLHGGIEQVGKAVNYKVVRDIPVISVIQREQQVRIKYRFPRRRSRSDKDIYDKDTVEPHLKDYLYDSESLEALVHKKISRQQHEYEVAVKSERIEIPDP